MRRLLYGCALLCLLALQSCQCSWKPDIGPVEDEDDATVEAPSAVRPLFVTA